MRNTWIKNVITLLLLIVCTFAAITGLTAYLNNISGTFELSEDGTPVLTVNPAWVHSITFTAGSDYESEVNVCTENASEYITVTEEAETFTIVLDDRSEVVNFYPDEEIELTISDVSVDFSGLGNVLQREIYIWSLCAVFGLILTLRLLWSRKPNLAAIAFVLVLVTALMIGLLRPDGLLGWDEEVHNDNLLEVFGNAQSFGARLNAISLWTLGYLPQGIGVMIARLFGLAEGVWLQAGYLSAALIYAVMAALTVHTAPHFKLGFLLLTLSPTILFQTAVATYDVAVFAACTLGTSMALRAYEKTEPLSFGEALTCVSLLFLGTLAKPAYSVLLLLLLMIPSRRFSSKAQKTCWCIFLVLLLAVALFSLTVPGPYDNVKSGDSRFEGADSAAQLAFMKAQPLHAAGILLKYFVTHLPTWLSGCFVRWGFAGRSFINGWVLLALLFVIAPLWTRDEEPGSVLMPGRRITLLCLALLPLLMLTVTQYVVSTVPGIDGVSGMQNRYFLPTVALLLLALALPKKLRFASKSLPIPIAAIAVFYTVGCSWCTVGQLVLLGHAML